MIIKIAGRLILFLMISAIILSSCTRPDTFLPDEIFGYKLSDKITGEQAKKMVDQLHFREVSPSFNEIGFYHKESGPLTVYVSRYRNSEEADSVLQKMSRKIIQDKQVFILGDYITFQDQKMFRCFGLSQTHFIFIRGRYLIWMSVNTIKAMDILEAYLKQTG
jgi:hypothetical protein